MSLLFRILLDRSRRKEKLLAKVIVKFLIGCLMNTTQVTHPHCLLLLKSTKTVRTNTKLEKQAVPPFSHGCESERERVHSLNLSLRRLDLMFFCAVVWTFLVWAVCCPISDHVMILLLAFKFSIIACI